MSELTIEQVQALEALQSNYLEQSTDVDGLPLNQSTYLRYLRARNFNVAKSKQLLDGTIEWRKSFGLSNLHESWSPIVADENNTGKVFVRGYDKLGHPILYMRPKLENSRNHDNNLKHLVYQLERTIACMKDEGEKMTLIIDYEGFSLMNSPPMKTSMETLHILQNHYPERLFRAYLIRPPWIFNAFWTAISPFIDPVTKAKIVMVSDPNKNPMVYIGFFC